MSTAENVSIRPIGPGDSIEELTELLHRSYSALGARGWNYTAVDQPVEVTRDRLADGTGLVAIDGDERIVGTITYWPPAKLFDSPWLRRPDVALLGRFAVEPSWQKRGIGARLMTTVERMARAAGAIEIALDTAEPAAHLVDWYGRCGYHLIEYVQWRGKRYRSVIMSKPL